MLLDVIGHRGTTKENSQLKRQNYFPWKKQIKLAYYVIKKTLELNVIEVRLFKILLLQEMGSQRSDQIPSKIHEHS